MFTQHKNLLNILALFMVIFIDVTGVVLVLPILTPLILQPASGMLADRAPLLWRDFLYGLALALFPLCMFFSTPIMGDLSDRYGRKKILMVCLSITVISYGISAYSIVEKNLLLFLISRAIAGFGAGTQPIANAAIIDFSTPQTKTRHLTWIVFVGSIGVIVGPLLGGITADKNLVSWFGYETPFIVSALLAAVNIACLWWYQEPAPLATAKKVDLSKGFKLFLIAFTEKRFSQLSLAFFGFSLGWGLYYQAITWLFMEGFHYTVGQLGIFVGFIGIVFALMTGIGVKLVLQLVESERRAFIVFAFIMGVANVGSGFASGTVGLWVWMVFNSCGNVLCYTISLSLFSNLVPEDRQGWIMGVASAIGAMTWAVAGLIAGPLGYFSIRLPLLAAGLLCFGSFIIMSLYKKPDSIGQEESHG